MSLKRKVTTVGGTIACALGIGYFMQQGESPAHHAPALQTRPIDVAQLEPMTETDEVTLELEQIVLTSASSANVWLPAEFRAAERSPMEFPATPSDPVTPVLGCDIVTNTAVQAMASVELNVSAPCFRNERLTVHHNGMMFSDTTDDTGNLTVTVPVLAENAVFILEFANGKGIVAVADVPTLKDFDRVALQWSGNGGFQVHAREFGAVYGEEGHVWSGSAHLEGAETDLINPHGVVTRLGDPDTLAPKLVEVYTFPSGRAIMSGSVQLSVEAEITEANCGRDVAAQALELRSNKTLRTRDLVLSMPDCSAIGDFLVLNNLVDDLMIASK